QCIHAVMRPVSQDVPIGSSEISLAQLNDRSREIFRQIVESYLATGEPVGSRNLSRIIPMTLSPASVRNVMSDLEQLGLIYAPHTSAGRLPTELGLRFFIDALMQIGDLSEEDRRSIEAQVAASGQGRSLESVLEEASLLLSGLSRAAGVVLTAKSNTRLKHIEFVRLEPERALVVLVAEDGQVENRVLGLPPGLPTSALIEATNFLNSRVRGRSLAEGVRIFIGSENKLFSLSGSSTIVAPYRDGAGRIVGVIGVIGPTRLNYSRIIPMVDYTSKVVSKVLGG